MKRMLSIVAFAAMMTTSALAETTVNAVMQSGLRILDPVITTTFITRYHGFMIYDTLIAHDAHLKPKPQMADWTVSDDQKIYTFTLRDGLKFHDGARVTAADVVASIKRWAQKDAGGQIIMARTEALEAPDDRTVVWKLSQPFAALLDIVAKQSSLPLFDHARTGGGHAGRQGNHGLYRFRRLQVRSVGIPASASASPMRNSRDTSPATSPPTEWQAARSSMSTGSNGSTCPISRRRSGRSPAA